MRNGKADRKNCLWLVENCPLNSYYICPFNRSVDLYFDILIALMNLIMGKVRFINRTFQKAMTDFNNHHYPDWNESTGNTILFLKCNIINIVYDADFNNMNHQKVDKQMANQISYADVSYWPMYFSDSFTLDKYIVHLSKWKLDWLNDCDIWRFC